MEELERIQKLIGDANKTLKDIEDKQGIVLANINVLNGQKEKIEKEIEVLKATKEQTIINEETRYQDKVNEINGLIDEKNKSLSFISNELDADRKELTELKGAIEVAYVDLDKVAEKAQKIYADKIKEAEDKIAQMEKDSIDIKNDYENVVSLLDKKTSEYNELCQKYSDDGRKFKTELDQLVTMVKENTDKMVSLSTEITRLTKRKGELENDYNVALILVDKISKMNDDISIMKSTRDDLQKEISTLEKTKEEKLAFIKLQGEVASKQIELDTHIAMLKEQYAMFEVAW